MDSDKGRYEDVPKDWRTIQKNTTKYFKDCEEKKEDPTFSGLYDFLGINRTTFKKIVNMLEDSTFREVEEATGIQKLTLKAIQSAFYKVMGAYEDKLQGKTGQPGAMFALETNADWYKATGAQKEKEQPLSINLYSYKDKKKQSKLIPTEVEKFENED